MRRMLLACACLTFAGTAQGAPEVSAPEVSPTTVTVGPQPDGSILASDNQILTPAGKMIGLGSPARAKAVALNTGRNAHSAAILLMHAAAPVAILDTVSGAVLQHFSPAGICAGKPAVKCTGSFNGIAYSPDGTRLVFSQDNNFISIAKVDPASGLLSEASNIAVPPPAGIQVFTEPGVNRPASANAGGIAITPDGRTALVALNASNEIGVIDLAAGTLRRVTIPVGNAPNSIVTDGKRAYVSNEGGRRAHPGDFTNLSDGTEIVADKQDAFAVTGTVSVIDLASLKVVQEINVGLHPAGLTLEGGKLYVANSYSDTLTVVDTHGLVQQTTLRARAPIAGRAFGAGPNAVAVDGTTAYVALGQSNAILVLDLAAKPARQVLGFIPTGYVPTSLALDKAHHQLIVADDKGIGARGAKIPLYGATGYNTHLDQGAAELIRLPTASQLATYTRQVIANNGWDSANTKVLSQLADPNAAAVAVPAHIGEKSLIKHVFLVIKENRTYDQILGDLPQGNGARELAIFAAATPNQHELVKRFPLLDNVYAPSRQSADGHPWIVESGAFYSNEILSPDWIRSYPGGNANDALTYTPRGFLWSAAQRKGLSVKMYGEWSETYKISKKPDGGEYSWADFYNTHLFKISGGKQGADIVPDAADTETTAVPSAEAILDPHYPSFNLDIPDQYRADYYIKSFQAQVATDQVPALTILWLPDDHTIGTATGHPLPASYQADNDLALGRIVEAISGSKAWASSAIFVEEDDCQNGVDHVDGHRQPVYVISPYAAAPQAPAIGRVIHTTYTQENINRTIENILGLEPLTQFDLVAAPMFDAFRNTPDFSPWQHVPETVALNIGPGNVPIPGTGNAAFVQREELPKIQLAWLRASDRLTAGHARQADVIDEDFLNHAVWYSATNWQRAYPGDSRIEPPSRFTKDIARGSR